MDVSAKMRDNFLNLSREQSRITRKNDKSVNEEVRHDNNLESARLSTLQITKQVVHKPGNHAFHLSKPIQLCIV